MKEGTNLVDQEAIRRSALLEELQAQRGFLGDRAANLAADLAIARVRIEELTARVAAITKERDEWKAKSNGQGELPLET